ncbi:MAG: metalloregulator ArsR/SmtB family transcription factor [Ignavibacteriales bacterium]|nr:metalloregulator ArsR/SmtB family transcription factor [Ignavibacteriales bacterium]
MGISKTEEFSARHNRIAAAAKALSHPARVAILEYLAQQNACICGDIVNHLPLSQATVSQHLAELKKAGLIKGETDGPRVCYCLDGKAWSDIREFLSRFFADVGSCCVQKQK